MIRGAIEARPGPHRGDRKASAMPVEATSKHIALKAMHAAPRMEQRSHVC